MKKLFLRTIAFLAVMLLCTNSVFGLTINSENTEQSSSSGVTTMEVVERNICDIDITDPSSSSDVIGNFTKELTDFDADEKSVTLTLALENLMQDETTTKSVEVFLVLDNSSSMSKTYNSKTKVDYVAETANLFVDSLFNYFDDVQIGIVSFSCAETDSTVGGTFHDGTEDDATLVLSLSDSADTVTSKITEYQNSERGYHTNIEAGLSVAEANFSDNSDSEKYIILISDGVPNLCLNTETTLTYSGVIASSTKSKLQELENDGYHVFSVLMGSNEADIENSSAPISSVTGNHMTYGELAEEIFGTASNPTVGEFYYIDYDNLDDTINTEIYGDITEVKDSTLKNIVIKDYFPQEIIDNFDFEYVLSPNIGSVSAEVDTTDNSITWTIEVLNAGEVATLSYKLTLKDDYDKEIVDQILPTNSKVDIDYTYDGEDKDVSSTVSPTVRVNYTEPTVENIVEDNTVATGTIPQTGSYSSAIFAIAIIGIMVFAINRLICYKKLNNKSKQ